MKADLHSHSYYSDGEFSPKRLIEMAKTAKLDLFSLTDHDCVTGVKEAKEYGRELSVNVISGIELSSTYGGTVHILGYGIDENNTNLNQKILEIKEKREFRNREILRKLSQNGVEISYDSLSKAGEGKTIGRRLIAELMIQKGYISTIQQAFDLYLADGKSCYVKFIRLTPYDAIDIIIKANGIPVLAHPSQIKMDDNSKFSFITSLKEAGLVGIESYYYTHSSYEIKYYEEIANKLDLISTAGSDYHGLSRNSFIGEVPREIDDRFIKLINK